jgi:hypothetical protein
MKGMEKRLSSLEAVEKKVTEFESELKKIWIYISDTNKATIERVGKVEERVETTDFSLSLANSKVLELEKEKDSLKDEIVYLQSQSMRNNLVFSNIPEAPLEGPDVAEAKLREFMTDKMKIAKDIVDKMGFERVHRIGPKIDGKTRKLVAKFSLFKERELVRKQWKALEGTPYYVNEQFPKEVIDKRRKLVPKMKDARREGKTAWIAYDTLYINGKPVKD